MSARTVLGFLSLWIVACTGSPAPFRITSMPQGADTRLTLIATPGLRINARIKPALELTDGSIVRFDSGSLSADSAYFAGPPTAVLPGRHSRVEGTLRASVCDEGALVCRSITLRF